MLVICRRRGWVFPYRHDVHSVDVVGQVLKTLLDAADQRCDLVGTKVIADIDTRQYPDLLRTDIGNKKLANGCYARVIVEKGSDSVPVGRWDRLAEEEVVIALHEAKTDAYEHKCNEDRGNRLRNRRPSDLAEGQANQREDISGN